MEKEVILSVRDLKQYFKLGSGKYKMLNKAVDGVSFDIKKGEVFSLVGESGCGKTTTGRTIIRLYNSSGGEVYFHGTRIISDLESAKETYKDVLAQITSQKDDQLLDLKERLSQNTIDEETYKDKVAKVNLEFDEQKASAKAILTQAKKDKKFDRQISEEGKEARKNLTELDDYKAIVKKYEVANEQVKKDLDKAIELVDAKKAKLTENVSKDELKAYKEDYQLALDAKKNLEVELKLNKKREKLDVSNLKYRLVYKNRLLMRKMQMIFQDPIASLNPRMTVKEIIAEGLRINGVKNEQEIDVRVKEALTTVGLVPEHASRYPHEFSGGQRQRIGIARALVVDPTFIIADEPISALDVSIRAQVINLLNDLRVEKGITILFIAHDLSVVKYFSDRLAVMYFGKIVEMGNKDSVYNHPLHPYTLSLMNSIPLPDPSYEKARSKADRYNPAMAHDYSIDKPELREIEPDHFVLCNEAEFKAYKEKLKTFTK